VAGTRECSNEPSGSIKCGEFLDYRKPDSFSRRTVLRGVSKYGTGMSVILSSISYEWEMNI
jgi:hypothetical protein